MEEGTSSSGPRSGIVASEGKRGTQLATGLPPLFEQVAQSHHLADKDDVGPSDHTLPDILQQFDNLDKSSARFPNQLVDLLSEKEYTTCITRLRDEDVTWFIDYLDNALDTLNPSTPAYQKCLGELRGVCCARKMLPRPYIPRICMDRTPGHDRCGPGEIFRWTLIGLFVESRRIFPLRKVFSPEGEELFCNVVKWKHLIHPNILPFLSYNLICAESLPRFMPIPDWIPGTGLNQYISNKPTIDRLDLLVGIASGLDYLHSHNVVHGDFGEPSILVDHSGCPRIKDFGVVGVIAAGLTKFKPDEYRHRLWCAAPEILNGAEILSRKADIFSFSMVVVEVFTGSAPFSPMLSSAAQSAIKAGKRPIRPTHQAFTNELWALTKHCWDPVPELRPEISAVFETLRAEGRVQGKAEEEVLNLWYGM